MYEHLLKKKLKKIFDDLYNGTWTIEELKIAMKLVGNSEVKIHSHNEVSFDDVYELLKSVHKSIGYKPRNEKERVILEAVYNLMENDSALRGLMKRNRYGEYSFESITISGIADWESIDWDEFTGYYGSSGWPKARYHSAKEGVGAAVESAIRKNLKSKVNDMIRKLSRMGIVKGPEYKYDNVFVTGSSFPTGEARGWRHEEMEGFVSYEARYEIDIYNLSKYVYEKIGDKLNKYFGETETLGLKSLIQEAIDYYELGYPKKEISEYLRDKIDYVRKHLDI